MTEKRTYELPPGEHAGNIAGIERIFVVDGKAGGSDVSVELSDPADFYFAEQVLGRKPTSVDADEPEPPAEPTQPEPGDADPLARLTGAELNEQLKAYELEATGSKAQKTARLKAAITNTPIEASEEAN